MSTLLSAKAICERALRRIGAFSLVDSQADAGELDEALIQLDLLLAELSGTERVYWLVPDTLTIPLVASTSSYSVLNTVTSVPPTGIEFPIAAWREDASGNKADLRMLTHREFDELQPATGLPTHIHIDRLISPTLRCWPTPGADTAANEWFVKLKVQTYAGDFADGNGNKSTGMRAAWQRWATYALSAELGSGSVRKLPASEIRDFIAIAEAAKTKLLAFENQQHTGLPAITEFRDF